MGPTRFPIVRARPDYATSPSNIPFRCLADNVNYYSRTLGNVKGKLMGSGDKFIGAVPGVEGKRKVPKKDLQDFLAEKEGFEPSRPFWGLHDFQSCALGRTTRLLQMNIQFCCLADNNVIIAGVRKKSRGNFKKTKNFRKENTAIFCRTHLGIWSHSLAEFAARRQQIGSDHVF